MKGKAHHRLEKQLKRGTLELLLLRLLSDESTYGYELISRLEKSSHGAFELKEGTVYPVLYRLEEAGHVRTEWSQPERGVPRKYYRLTKGGEQHLEILTAAWRNHAAAVEAVLQGGSPEEEES